MGKTKGEIMCEYCDKIRNRIRELEKEIYDEAPQSIKDKLDTLKTLKGKLTETHVRLHL